MLKYLCYVLFLLWFSYLIASSMLLFSHGFLLTRIVQNQNTSCISFNEAACDSEEYSFDTIDTNFAKEVCSKEEKLLTMLKDPSASSKICLPPKARVVLLIIDALRYDFTVYDESNEEPLPYQNQLPIINKLVKEQRERARLYKFIADPPTTTMQRLKALTTGSLPTFVDAGSNFASAEIAEDNLIDQLSNNGHKIVFMGDDTWNSLYPNRFLRGYFYPSFDVWDLDTVDNGVREHLHPELQKNDWNLLVGHFLGVDHCGHRYGPNHPEMKRKLSEMNDVITNIADALNNDTMLFIIGDHGMTSRGDHGGESEDETTAAMFVYSKKPLFSFSPANPVINQEFITKQVNLVPTLATLLGIPIPFQNLGTLILDCLPITNITGQSDEWRLILHSLWTNVRQMMSYIESYSRESKEISEDKVKASLDQFLNLQLELAAVTEEKMQKFHDDCIKFMKNLRGICEELWIKFDSFSMTRGLLLAFLSIFLVFAIVDGIPSPRISELFQFSFIFCSYFALGAAAIFTVVLKYFDVINDLIPTLYFSTGLTSQFMLAVLVIQNWGVISLNWYDKNKKYRILNLICRLVLVCNLCGLFSNSYIIEESFVLLFLLVTVIVASTICISCYNAKSDWKIPKIKLILSAIAITMSVRFTMNFWCCREEQTWCFQSPEIINTVTAKVPTTKFQWVVTVIFLALLVIVSKLWLKNCGNLNGYSLNVTLTRYLPTVLVVCVSGYWVLQRLPQPKGVVYQTPNVLAWSVYSLALIAISVIIFKPLLIYFIPRNQELLQDDPGLIPHLFNKMKKNETDEEDVPIVCGLSTVYSAVFVTIGIYLILLFALLLGDVLAPSTVIMYLTSGCVLIVTSVLRIENASSIENLFEVPNVSVITWVILSQYFFYATGHQPTFPNIQWDAAFVGLTGLRVPQFLNATLVVINTFCSYIFMGVLLPLIIIAPFTVFVMFPTIVSKKKELQLLAQHGELMIFEKDDVIITNAFACCCKYIMCHGMRAFASMMAATIHCRHLMAWNIFAPKFIFESLSMMVTLASVMVGFLILLRVNKKVEDLVIQLNKSN